MTWFNMCCLMFRRQETYDLLIKVALANPKVTAINFLLHESEREAWQTLLLPRIHASSEADKVGEVRWLRTTESISFILSEVEEEGRVEALISFWGEPFMARITEHQVPRYVLRVRGHSDLLPRLAELVRQHRMRADEATIN